MDFVPGLSACHLVEAVRVVLVHPHGTPLIRVQDSFEVKTLQPKLTLMDNISIGHSLLICTKGTHNNIHPVNDHALGLNRKATFVVMF